MSAALLLPKRLHLGRGASGHLLITLQEAGFTRPLFVTDPYMVSSGLLARISAPLHERGIAHRVFDRCVPDPTTESIREAVTQALDFKPDVVIGLGGGSSMDTAKMVAVMVHREGPIRDFKVPYRLDTGLPIIAIPTTAGTGSEATAVAVVTDTTTDEKMLCAGLGLMPIAALVDYELTLSMPKRLTADTGLDTLCHALEAFVSRKANPFTDDLARDVMRLVPRWLPIAWAEPNNRDAREALMMAALKGGMAFSNASVTLIHGMSRPIGAHYHVPHGMSNAMLLPTITAWSIPGSPERYAEAAKLMGFAEPDTPDAQCVSALTDGLTRLCRALEVPSPAAFGIREEAWFSTIETMAEQALASGSPGNNPRVPTQQEIVKLYEDVWLGGVALSG